MKKKYLILIITQLCVAKTAVAIIGFNRPQYFEEMLTSIEKCPEIQNNTIDVFLFLDGGKKSKQDEYTKIALESSIKFKEIICREYNFYLVANIIKAREYIFDVLDYDDLILLEDDMVVTPQYFTLMHNLKEWALKHYDNIGGISLHSVDGSPREHRLQTLNLCHVSNGLQGMLMTKFAWDTIKDYLIRYMKEYYRKRTRKINPVWECVRNYHQQQVLEFEPYIEDDPRILKGYYSHLRDKALRKALPTGQDAATMLAFMVNNLVIIHTHVTRLHNIGRIGVHSYNGKWWDKKLKHTFLEEFTEDTDITEFKLS